MDRFRRLIVTALLAGATAGLILFVVQHLTIVPLIDLAEGFEDAAAKAHSAAGHAHAHADEGWQPAPGAQRIALTALTTMLSGTAFAAILLAVMNMGEGARDPRQGLLWGLAGFACFVLAPALGLPPKPPGAAVGDLHARQVWWALTVVATAAGLWLACQAGSAWWVRVLGLIPILLPHAIGAPGPEGADEVPRELMRRFALVSVATNFLFWVVLGGLCGWLRGRNGAILDHASG